MTALRYSHSCCYISSRWKHRAHRTWDSPLPGTCAAQAFITDLSRVPLSALISIFHLPKVISGKIMTGASLPYKLSDSVVLELSSLCFMRNNIKCKGFSWMCYFVLTHRLSLASECSKFWRLSKLVFCVFSWILRLHKLFSLIP